MKLTRFILAAVFAACLYGQTDDSNARPPVTKADIEIVRRAAQILSSPAKWNRADNRVCPAEAATFSIYCALEKATQEISRNFEHRGAAMQEARFVIEEVAPDAQRYSHRLMDYNNDPNTTFADVQGVFWLLEKRIAVRLANPQPAAGTAAAAGGVTKSDIEVARRVRQLLDSPEKWNHKDDECVNAAKTLSLLCAFEQAQKDVTGSAEDAAAIREARAMVSELDPDHAKYKARLADYNADPAVTFADLQKFLASLEERLTARVAGK